MSRETHSATHESIRTAGATSAGVLDAPNRDLYLTAELRRSLLIHETSSALAAEPLLSGSRGHVLVVADGSDSAPSGALASHVALRTLASEWVDSVRWVGAATGEAAVRADMANALARCQDKLEQLGWDGVGASRPRCSLTTALIRRERAIFAHSGHCSGMLVRAGEVFHLTTPHADTNRHPDDGFVELSAVDLRPGDCIALCSDGVADHLDDRDLAAAIQVGDDLDDAARTITTLARSAGSRDDATVVLARIPDDPGALANEIAEAAFSAEPTPTALVTPGEPREPRRA